MKRRAAGCPSRSAPRGPITSLAADEAGYTPSGGDWRGGVWPSTNTMVIRGLEAYGCDALARDIALNHLEQVADVYRKTGTCWESYAPDHAMPGDSARKDFVGWSGLAPILYFMEYGIGRKPDAGQISLTWRIDPALGEIGCRNYRFAGRTLQLRAKPLPGGDIEVAAESDLPVTLTLKAGGRQRTAELKGKAHILL